MAAPSKTFTVVTDARVDADSPWDETIAEDLRDNDIHLEEWLGKNYTAAVDHDHNGTNSKKPTWGSMAAGNYIVMEDTSEVTTTSDSYVKIKEAKIAMSGTLRIDFDMRMTAGSGPVYAYVYRNGSPVGSVQSTASGTDDFKTQDISGWSDGDLVQIYAKADNYPADEVAVNDFRIKVSVPPVAGYYNP